MCSLIDNKSLCTSRVLPSLSTISYSSPASYSRGWIILLVSTFPALSCILRNRIMFDYPTGTKESTLTICFPCMFSFVCAYKMSTPSKWNIRVSLRSMAPIWDLL